MSEKLRGARNVPLTTSRSESFNQSISQSTAPSRPSLDDEHAFDRCRARADVRDDVRVVVTARDRAVPSTRRDARERQRLGARAR